jgi:hypothetical protein
MHDKGSSPGRTFITYVAIPNTPLPAPTPPRVESRGMALALTIFGVSFAAFCVWLAVRIVNRHERWAKRTLAVVVALPVLYVASFGPACWLTSQVYIGGEQIMWNRALIIYIPLARMIWEKPPEDSRFSHLLCWWMTLGVPKGQRAIIPLEAKATTLLLMLDPADL